MGAPAELVTAPNGATVNQKVLEHLEFTDGDRAAAGLHIRRAVAEFLPEPDDHYRDADIIHEPN